MVPIGVARDAGGSAPLVVIGLIALNVAAFLLELAQPSQGALQSFIQAWGVVPHEYVVRHDLPPTIPLPFWSTLLTSMSCTPDGCTWLATCSICGSSEITSSG